MKDMFTQRQDFAPLQTEYFMLAKELSEMWMIPYSWASVFNYVIYDEPAQMKYTISGAKSPLIDGESTPLLECMAYDGVEMGWWSLKDVDLPASVLPIEENQTVRGLAVWMAEGVEKNE